MANLYMFAVMPPEHLAEEIEKERVSFAEKYNCQAALKPPVHITLMAPFQVEYDLKERIEALQHWAKNQRSFQIQLKNFSFFENPLHPVLYIDVLKNSDITSLYKSFNKEVHKFVLFGHGIKNPFRPHITIGYRDIPSEVFPEIMNEYSTKRFEASFMCDAIYLWRHNGKHWQEEAAYSFQDNDSKLFQLELF